MHVGSGVDEPLFVHACECETWSLYDECSVIFLVSYDRFGICSTANAGAPFSVRVAHSRCKRACAVFSVRAPFFL